MKAELKLTEFLVELLRVYLTCSGCWASVSPASRWRVEGNLLSPLTSHDIVAMQRDREVKLCVYIFLNR